MKCQKAFCEIIFIPNYFAFNCANVLLIEMDKQVEWLQSTDFVSFAVVNIHIPSFIFLNFQFHHLFNANYAFLY